MTRMRKSVDNLWVFLLTCVVLGTSAPVVAQLTSGADFLKIQSGARGMALGGSYTAVAEDITALTWNPAGLAWLTRPEAGYLRMPYLADMSYNFAGLAIPLGLGDGAAFGAGFISLSIPSFDSTLGLQPSVSAGDMAGLVSFAYKKKIFSGGITGKYIQRKIAGITATTFGGDLGFLVKPMDMLSVGLCLMNMGAPIKFIKEADSLPGSLRLGVAFKPLEPKNQHQVILTTDSALEFQGSTAQIGVGSEYCYSGIASFRVGYGGDHDRRRLTAGVGLNVEYVEFDYAYVPFGTLGDTHQFSVIFRFGAPPGSIGRGAKPPAPTALTAKPAGQGMSLRWLAPTEGAEKIVGYHLYVKEPGRPGLERLTKQPVKRTELTLRRMVPRERYQFGVVSVSDAGAESNMAKISFIPDPAPVSAVPTGLKAEGAVEGVAVFWQAVPAAVGYQLYIADDDGKPVKKLNTAILKDTRVVLKRLNPDNLYRLTVTSVNTEDQESEAAFPVAFKPADLPKPTEVPIQQAPSPELSGPVLRAQSLDGAVQLNWNAVPGAVGYLLYVSIDNGNTFKKLTPTPRKTVSVILRPLVNGRPYIFAVTWVSASGVESAKLFSTTVRPGPVPVPEP